MLIRIILVVSTIIFSIWLLKKRNSARARAWQKLLIITFLVGVITLTVSQDLSTRFALFFGIPRATDVVLYLTVVIFLFVGANFLLRLEDVQKRLTVLNRSIALRDAQQKYPNWSSNK
jgi:small membrane protein